MIGARSTSSSPPIARRGRARSPAVVDHRRVAEREVELEVGAVRRADAAADLLDQLRHPLAQRRVERARRAGAASARPGITFGASPAWNAADRDHGGLQRIDPARDDVLQAARRAPPRRRPCRPRCGGAPACPPLAGDREREEVRGGHERRPARAATLPVRAAASTGGSRRRSPRPPSRPPRPARARRPGASSSACWKMNRSSPPSSPARAASSRAAPEQHRGVPVVPAGVHRARRARRRTRRRSPRGSAARRCRRAARACGPGRPVRRCATTLVSDGRVTSSPPKPSSVSATKRAVSRSS